jgi:hypothetical protein
MAARRVSKLDNEEPHVSFRKEVTCVTLMLLMMCTIAASVIIIAPLLPIDNSVTIGANGHQDYARSITAGKSVTMWIDVTEETPRINGEAILLYVMDSNNYNLKTSGSQAYSVLLVIAAISENGTVWQVPADGEYYFVVENPTASSITVTIKITWELEWLPAVALALALFCIVITSVTILYGELASRLVPRTVVSLGDLDLLPDVITNAPSGLRSIVLNEPIEKRCAVCSTSIEEGEAVLRCPHCGSVSHSEHFLGWVRTKGYCPRCGEHLDEQDIQPADPTKQEK